MSSVKYFVTFSTISGEMSLPLTSFPEMKKWFIRCERWLEAPRITKVIGKNEWGGIIQKKLSLPHVYGSMEKGLRRNE